MCALFPCWQNVSTFENMNDIPVPKVNDDENEDLVLDRNSEKVYTK